MRPMMNGLILASLLAAGSALAAPRPQLPPDPPAISGGAEANLLAQRALSAPDSPPVQAEAPVFPGAGFDAFAFDDNATVNGGFLFIPPDPIGAAGTDRVIAVVNAGLEARTKLGALIFRSSLQGFFAPSGGTLGTFCFDPKIVYDHHAGRFVVVALEQTDVGSGAASDESRILVAVSRTSSPATATAADWYYMVINSKLTIGAGATWADYPGLEVDEEAVYITSNFFPFSTSAGSFGQRLFIIAKGLVGGFYGGGAGAYTVHAPYTAAGLGGFETTTMPCEIIQPGGAGPGIGTFLLSYSGLTYGGAAQPEALVVIRVDNPLGATTFTSEFVTIADIEDVGGAFGWPALPDAPQAGGAGLIEVNDRRALDAVWRNGYLYLTTTINPNAAFDPANTGQTTAHWLRLDATAVVSSASPAGLIVLDQEGNIGGEDIAPNTYTFFPSVAVNGADEMKVGFSASATTIFGSAYVAGRVPLDPPGTVGPSALVRAGVDYYYRAFGGTRNRWGDYSGMSLDPTDDSVFWAFNQWADLRGTVISGEDGRWGTAWLQSSFAPIGAPDLIVSDFAGPCCVYGNQAVGTQMLVEVTNIGLGAAGGCQLGLYLSPDPLITVGDAGLAGGTIAVPPLAPGASVVLAIPAGVAVPGGAPLGLNFLGAIVDETNLVVEADETNNTAADDTEYNQDLFGCVRGEAAASLQGVVSVFVTPDGTGDPLSAAQQFMGVGVAPAPWDATITVRALDAAGTPVAGQLFSLASTAGNLVLCPATASVDGPTNAAGVATFSGPIYGGGFTDLGLDEQMLVVGGGQQPLPGLLYGYPEMLGSGNAGDLYRVHLPTGTAFPLCPLDPAGLTEIEYDPLTATGWAQEPSAAATILSFDWQTCTVTGGPYGTAGLAFNGLEWIDGVLYGTGVLATCAPSDLFVLDPPAGAFNLIGPTGEGPIAGLAWDPVCRKLYGVTGCRAVYGTSRLVEIDLNSGAATLIGDTGVELGSLELGPDGLLYAGGSAGDGANLYTLDRHSAAPTPVGPTGIFNAVSGLALVSDAGIPLRFNSPDLSGDLAVDLTDASMFTSLLYNGIYDYAIDFRFDGAENLSDASAMASQIAASCPAGPAPVAATVEPRRAEFALDLEGTDAQGVLVLAPGEAGVARLRIGGEAARLGVTGWEARIGSSANVVIDGVDLAAGSLDLGRDGDMVVGLAAPLGSGGPPVDVATVRFHVTDAEAAYLTVAPPVRSSVGGAGPAVVSADRTAGVVAAGVKSYQEGAAAVINAVPGAGVPLALDLRNAPNPFNPRTEFSFNLPRTGQVELRVYDLRGRLVWSARPGELAAGAQVLAWHGVDQRGGAVNSGVYFYQLLLDGQKLGEPGKMTLLK